jgi:hypothetical protein
MILRTQPQQTANSLIRVTSYPLAAKDSRTRVLVRLRHGVVDVDLDARV